MRLHFHNYRFADEVLSSKNFLKAKTETLDILSRLSAIKVGEPPWSIPSKKPKKALLQVRRRRPARSNVEEQVQRNNSQGAFCLQCGAWRGSYGLEPTIDLY